MSSNAASVILPIQSTAGAVPILNEKGEVSMQKVKVHRYVSGKRPEYAPASSDEDESDEEFGGLHGKGGRAAAFPDEIEAEEELAEAEIQDPRLQRLRQRQYDEEVETVGRRERIRHVAEPEILDTEMVEEPSYEYRRRESSDEEDDTGREKRRRGEASDEEEDEELDDEEIEQRRKRLKEKALDRLNTEQELMNGEDEEPAPVEIEESEEDSEYEYTDSEDEDIGPRLKPVFVRRRERLTVVEKEKEAQKERQAQQDAKRMQEDRRRQTLKMLEQDIRREQQEKDAGGQLGDNICTDDENDEADYELWKQRELRRIKRDREEKEQREKEQMDIEKMHSMTEDERRAELRSNPRVVTNKSVKGKYKFLQKYYHRGAFFLEQDDDVYKRDVSAPTLEDHFDKTILPKVMQVKNFGRSGRTKYTHLVDQDSTQFDSPWATEAASQLKFSASNSVGMKNTFERPSLKRKKREKGYSGSFGT